MEAYFESVKESPMRLNGSTERPNQKCNDLEVLSALFSLKI